MRLPRWWDWHATILRSASFLAPGPLREEWLAEWQSELWYVRRTGTKRAVAFCVGAFADALWLRRNLAEKREWSALGTGWSCILVLGLMALVAFGIAVRLPVQRDTMLPAPYREPEKLVMISSMRVRVEAPSVPFASFRALAGRFTEIAYYQPARMRLQTGEMTVAVASPNLFRLLGLPAAYSSSGLILSEEAWRKYFHGDPGILGRTLTIEGRRIAVAGLLPVRYWRLPGKIDGWLLQDDAVPLQARGFVIARSEPRRRGRWFLSAPDDAGRQRMFECASLAGPTLFRHFLVLSIALIVLAATRSLALGDYPSNGHAHRRWLFLAVKFGLLTVIVFCGTLDLAAILSTGIQPHGLMIGYYLAFRWALSDQRKRCPVCLRRLTNPTRIGTTSQTFLAWYGTEFICTKGHGLMHVPEIPTSCFSRQRWLDLDPSWAGLFSSQKV